MKFISFGPLELDYFIRDNLLVGLTPGGSSLLTLMNLGANSTYISTSGKDIQAKLVLNILSKLNIKSINKVTSSNTKILFIKPKTITNICPYCDRTSYYEYNLDSQFILDNINDEKIIIDNLYEETLEVLSNLDNEVYLFLKTIDSLKYYNLDELSNINNLELVFLNESVSQYLIKKYDIDEVDLLNIFHAKLLIINKNKKGIEFITNDIIYEKDNELEKETIDNTGSEEALFATIIKIYLEHNKELNEKVLSMMFIKGESLYTIVKGVIGGTSHLIPNYTLDSYKECICTDIKVKNE